MKSEHILFENKPAEYFTEAYPIGNGKLGGMVYGDPVHMRLGLNHDELWEGHQPDVKGGYDLGDFLKFKELTLAGKYLEANEYYNKTYARHDGGGYISLGDLFIDFPEGEITDYRRELDIKTSVAAVSFKLDGNPVSVEYIASYPRSSVLVNIKSEKEISYAVSVDLERVVALGVKGNRMTAYGQLSSLCERQIMSSDRFPDNELHSGVRFAAAIEVKTSGEASLIDERYTVKACEATVAFSCETTFKNGKEYGKDNYKELASDYVDSALALPYADIKSEHIADVGELYGRVKFTLGSDDLSDVPTSERILAFNSGSSDYALLVLEFNLGRYFLISASRQGSRPANLQGIWNESTNPPWSSNYTVNINTEMNYWPALPCAMPELLDPLESQISILSETGRAVARELYGKRGISASHNSDIFGQAFPASGRAEWSYFPLSFGWLLRELYNKYEYTLDRSYLDSIYKYLEGNAEFIVSSLYDDGDYLIMTPATSAENQYYIGNDACSVAKSSAFFASIAREGIENFIKASDILGKRGELYDSAKACLPRMLPLRITDDGRIEEWYFGGSSVSPREPEPTHRHISHLYELYPARNINKNTPELFAAAKESLHVRGDEATGWSLGWKINCYARFHDGEGVMRLMRMFMRPVDASVNDHFHGGGVYPNLFCAHPPFQIDGNFGYTAAVCEMLFDIDGENVTPLHALPRELKCGSISGVMLPGGRRADLSWEDGKVKEFKLY